MTQNNISFPNSISSIDDCLKIISYRRKKIGISKKLFFRGHGKADWELSPVLFREKLRDHEKHILDEMTSRRPNEFSEDKTIFERLVRAQHYELPTRLLDITANPLIALFFACSSETEEDGELILFSKEESKIKYHNSHTVSCLSALAEVNLEESEIDLLKKLNRLLDEQEFSKSQNGDRLLSLLNDRSPPQGAQGNLIIDDEYHTLVDKIVYGAYSGGVSAKRPRTAIGFIKFIDHIRFEIMTKIKDILEETLASKGELIYPPAADFFFDLEKIASRILQKSYIGELLFLAIAEERPGFQNNIQLYDLFAPLFVYPKQNNPRITAQQGAFLLFGLEESIKKEEEKKLEIFRYTIPQESKESILGELDLLGINKSFIYPELEKLSSYIVEDIKKRSPYP